MHEMLAEISAHTALLNYPGKIAQNSCSVLSWACYTFKTKAPLNCVLKGQQEHAKKARDSQVCSNQYGCCLPFPAKHSVTGLGGETEALKDRTSGFLESH